MIDGASTVGIFVGKGLLVRLVRLGECDGMLVGCVVSFGRSVDGDTTEEGSKAGVKI